MIDEILDLVAQHSEDDKPIFLYQICCGVLPSVDLYLISEKSIWKDQAQQTGFLVYFELDFYCLCSLQKSISKFIFAG